jgi:hypothetical protein
MLCDNCESFIIQEVQKMHGFKGPYVNYKCDIEHTQDIYGGKFSHCNRKYWLKELKKLEE